MIYLAVPNAILQNKGNFAMVSINFPICFLLADPTLRSLPADPVPCSLRRLDSARAQDSQCGPQAAPRGQKGLGGCGGGQRRLDPGEPGEAHHHSSLAREGRGGKRNRVGRAAFLAEGLCWHPLVRAGVAHPGPTAEGQGPQPGEQAVSHGQYWE